MSRLATAEAIAFELIDRYSWRTRADAQPAVFGYIDAFYNSRQRHSGLGYVSPAEFERRYRSQTITAAWSDRLHRP